jgi:hypothetical protein
MTSDHDPTHLDSLLAAALALLPNSHPAKPAAHNLAADCLAVAARPEAEGGGYATAVVMARNFAAGVRAWVATERALRPMAGWGEGKCGEAGRVLGERMPGAAEKKAVVWWLVSRVQKAGGLKAEMVRGSGGVGGRVEAGAGWWCVEGGGGWWRVPMKDGASDSVVSQEVAKEDKAA